MDAVSFLKTKVRLCKSSCCDCPLYSENNGHNVTCTVFMNNFAEEAVDMIQKWSAKHPLQSKTIYDDFVEKHPYAEFDNISGIPEVCAKALGYVDSCNSQGPGSCKDCWQTQIDDIDYSGEVVDAVDVLKSDDNEDLDKINRLIRNKLNVDDVFVFEFVLCDNEVNTDNEKFTIKALHQIKDSCIGVPGNIFEKPNVAVIFDSWLESVTGRQTMDGEQLWQVKAKAYMMVNEENMSLIKRIAINDKEKRYSICLSVRDMFCSICFKDRSSCEHIKGKTYDIKCGYYSKLPKLAFNYLENVTDIYSFSCNW